MTTETKYIAQWEVRRVCNRNSATYAPRIVFPMRQARLSIKGFLMHDPIHWESVLERGGFTLLSVKFLRPDEFQAIRRSTHMTKTKEREAKNAA